MLTLNPISGGGGALISNYAERMADRLARRRAEEEARAARAQGELLFRSRSRFLANMNHELRTPLNAIIGFATMLKESDSYKLDPDQRRAYAEYVLQSADLLLSHINTILEIAALEGGNLDVERGRVDLRTLVREAIERVRIMAEAAEVHIEDKSSMGAVLAWGDGERVAQALDHILRAAVAASDKKAKVLVRAILNDDGEPEIAVRDNGAGLSTQEAEAALNAIDQVRLGLDQSLAKPGAGLAIAAKFLEMQGGRLVLKSRLKHGTLARLILPLAEGEEQADPPETGATDEAGEPYATN